MSACVVVCVEPFASLPLRVATPTPPTPHCCCSPLPPVLPLLPPTDVRPPTRPPCRYGASYWRLLRANLVRSWHLQLRSSLFMYVRVFQILLMAFVVATCYMNVGKDTLDDGEARWARCAMLGTLRMLRLHAVLGCARAAA